MSNNNKSNSGLNFKKKKKKLYVDLYLNVI